MAITFVPRLAFTQVRKLEGTVMGKEKEKWVVIADIIGMKPMTKK